MITPRYYQEEAIDSIYHYFMNGGKGNPVIALPTASGKSIVPACFIERVMKRWSNQRFLVMTHVSTLITQNKDKMLEVWANAPLGIHSAGLNRRDTIQPIIFGGIQSMIKVAEAFGHRDIIFIDECHLVSQDENSHYLKFIAIMKSINPDVKIIGLTATKFRMGQGLLTQDGLFTDIIYDMTDIDGFNKLLEEGYLSPLIPRPTNVKLDTSNVGMQKGEFIQSQLQHEVDKAEITWKALQETIYFGANRRSWLIFASGIEHSNHIAEMLNQLGIECASVHSKQKSEYNLEALKAHKNLELRAIVSYSKLTTGLDHPAVDFIDDLRPTMSVVLHIQKYGRGMRLYPGKTNCIAEGSLVLTQNGLIPIEKITLYDKVWDGENFVFHDGVIYKGYRKVIKYEGLYATPEHRVYTKEGWQTFRECFEKRIGIAITEISGEPVQQSENIFSRNKIFKTFSHSSPMYELLRNIFQGIYKHYKIKSWLQKVWKFKWEFTKVVDKALFCCQTTLYKLKEQSLQKLWWEGNKIQFCFSFGNGDLDKKQYRTSKRQKYRSKRQQWTLRSWKFKIFNALRKHEKSKINKKHVFDITNAGRHNRFTVNGLLVHNCLVLDHANNIPRLGPVNDPIIPRKKGDKTGEIPIKICEACGVYNHIKAVRCDACGNPFEFKVKIIERSGTEELIRNPTALQIETFDVSYVTYGMKQKTDKAPYIVATYFSGFNTFKEFIFPENKRFKKPFVDWWRQRHVSEPPETTADCMRHISELRAPRRIRVHTNKMINGRNFPEVLGAEW